MKPSLHSISFALALVLGQVLLATANAQTQAEMNKGAIAEMEHADHIMTVIYQEIIQRYSKEPYVNQTLVENLRKAQRAWIAFRDAHIKAIYPDEKRFSARPMCAAIVRTELTKARTVQLREWLDESEEGDVCAGTRPRKPAVH